MTRFTDPELLAELQEETNAEEPSAFVIFEWRRDEDAPCLFGWGMELPDRALFWDADRVLSGEYESAQQVVERWSHVWDLRLMWVSGSTTDRDEHVQTAARGVGASA